MKRKMNKKMIRMTSNQLKNNLMLKKQTTIVYLKILLKKTLEKSGQRKSWRWPCSSNHHSTQTIINAQRLLTMVGSSSLIKN